MLLKTLEKMKYRVCTTFARYFGTILFQYSSWLDVRYSPRIRGIAVFMAGNHWFVYSFRGDIKTSTGHDHHQSKANTKPNSSCRNIRGWHRVNPLMENKSRKEWLLKCKQWHSILLGTFIVYNRRSLRQFIDQIKGKVHIEESWQLQLQGTKWRIFDGCVSSASNNISAISGPRTWRVKMHVDYFYKWLL